MRHGRLNRTVSALAIYSLLFANIPLAKSQEQDVDVFKAVHDGIYQACLKVNPQTPSSCTIQASYNEPKYSSVKFNKPQDLAARWNPILGSDGEKVLIKLFTRAESLAISNSALASLNRQLSEMPIAKQVSEGMGYKTMAATQQMIAVLNHAANNVFKASGPGDPKCTIVRTDNETIRPLFETPINTYARPFSQNVASFWANIQSLQSKFKSEVEGLDKNIEDYNDVRKKPGELQNSLKLLYDNSYAQALSTAVESVGQSFSQMIGVCTGSVASDESNPRTCKNCKNKSSADDDGSAGGGGGDGSEESPEVAAKNRQIRKLEQQIANGRSGGGDSLMPIMIGALGGLGAGIGAGVLIAGSGKDDKKDDGKREQQMQMFQQMMEMQMQQQMARQQATIQREQWLAQYEMQCLAIAGKFNRMIPSCEPAPPSEQPTTCVSPQEFYSRMSQVQCPAGYGYQWYPGYQSAGQWSVPPYFPPPPGPANPTTGATAGGTTAVAQGSATIPPPGSSMMPGTVCVDQTNPYLTWGACVPNGSNNQAPPVPAGSATTVVPTQNIGKDAAQVAANAPGGSLANAPGRNIASLPTFQSTTECSKCTAENMSDTAQCPSQCVISGGGSGTVSDPCTTTGTPICSSTGTGRPGCTNYGSCTPNAGTTTNTTTGTTSQTPPGSTNVVNSPNGGALQKGGSSKKATGQPRLPAQAPSQK